MRKRLLVEGYYQVEIDRAAITAFFQTLCATLNLRQYGEPIIFSPGGEGKEENQGYDAFIPLIDSGISLYVWTKQHFFSCVIFTCKDFDEKRAIEHISSTFSVSEIESSLF